MSFLPLVEQQVLDMLRDRLSDALSDVAVLRTHAFQMQEAYSAECLAVKVAKEERDMRGNSVQFKRNTMTDDLYFRFSNSRALR